MFEECYLVARLGFPFGSVATVAGLKVNYKKIKIYSSMFVSEIPRPPFSNQRCGELDNGRISKHSHNWATRMFLPGFEMRPLSSSLSRYSPTLHCVRKAEYGVGFIMSRYPVHPP